MMYGCKLTPHFSMWEFTVSETATRRGLPNVPSDTEWSSLEELSKSCLEPARDHCGPLHVTSGFRSPSLNAAIGGAVGSQHCKGEAVDVIPFHGTLVDLFRWLHVNVPFDQLIWEFGEWVHLSHSAVRDQRRETLIAARVNASTRYSQMTQEQMDKL